jgi:hypothetical protein
MNRLVLFAARFHPRSWRARYGDEFDQLLRDEGSSVGVLLDVLVNALRAQLRQGGSIMSGVPRRPERLALVGLALMVPSAVLVTASVLKYIVGVPGPFDAIEPSITPIVTHPVGETFFILAPYGALLLAALPVTRLAVSAGAGRMQARVEVTAPLVNVAVAIASVLLAAVMLVYWLAENL